MFRTNEITLCVLYTRLQSNMLEYIIPWIVQNTSISFFCHTCAYCDVVFRSLIFVLSNWVNHVVCCVALYYCIWLYECFSWFQNVSLRIHIEAVCCKFIERQSFCCECVDFIKKLIFASQFFFSISIISLILLYKGQPNKIIPTKKIILIFFVLRIILIFFLLFSLY